MYNSPNKLHKIALVYLSEIRFGPAYYSLQIDGQVIANRIFGDCFCWSSDSKYLAVQEWLTTDYGMGPITRVFILEIENKRFVGLKNLDKGFVQDFVFEGSTFVYKRDVKGIVGEVEVDIGTIDTWEDCLMK